MRKRIVRRIAFAGILFFTGTVVGSIALTLYPHPFRQVAQDQNSVHAGGLVSDHEKPPNSARQAIRDGAGFQEVDLTAEIVEPIESALIPDLEKLLQAADRLAYQGNVRGALLLYEQISQIDPVYQRMNVRLRSAYCAELSNDYRTAARAYQSLVDEAVDPRFLSAGQLGVARINFTQGNLDESQQILWQMFLKEGLYRTNDQMRSRVMFALINISLAELAGQLSSDALDSIERTHQHSDELDLMQEILALDYQIPQETSTAESRESPADASRAGNEAETNLINPRSISCDISLTGANKLNLLKQVAEQAGLVLNSSEAANNLLSKQFQDVNCRGLQLELLLDALLVSHDIQWSIDNGKLSLAAAEASPDARWSGRLSAVERLIRHSILSYPEKDAAWLARIDLVNLEFWRKNYASAVQRYRALLREPILSRQIPTIRYNIGVACLRLGDQLAAEEQFQQVIDNGLTEPLLAKSHYRLGVIQLDDDRSKDAQRSFAYAMNAANKNQSKSSFCIAEASAYLATQNPFRALQVMEQNRDLFYEADDNKTAAFLVALARYSILGKEDKEASQLLLNSLSHVDPTSMPGLSGYHLMSEAFQQLGLSGESLRSREAGVRFARSALESIRRAHAVEARASKSLTRLEFQLAGQYVTDDKRDAARQVLQRICCSDDVEYRMRSLLRLAELSHGEQKYDESIEWCRKAIAEDAQLNFKHETLTLLGDVFRDKGNRVTAAMCYAGLTPTFEEL